MKIGANIPSLLTYNSMNKASKNFATSSQRLSSGVKINSSADDPAGLAIANKIRLQVRGLEQASQNASNGTSMIQTAEGALTAVHSMLQRIRELALQAANDTNELEDRLKMQDEIDQLMDEINDIPLKTEYNKIKLLNGECDRIIYSYPTGAPTGPAGVSVLRMSDTTPYANLTFEVTALAENAVVTPDTLLADPLPDPALEGLVFGLNGVIITIDEGETSDTLLTKIKNAANEQGIIATPGTGFNIIDRLETIGVGESEKIVITGDQDLLDAIGLGSMSGVTSGTNAVIDDLGGGFDLDTATWTSDGNRVTIRDRNNVEVCFDINPALNLTPPSTNGKQTIMTKHGPLIIQVGANKDMGMYMIIPKINATTIQIDKASVTTRENASKTILLSDKAIALVSETRSKLGAYQNRLEHTVANLDNSYINASESLSRIEDTDMAREMTEYAKFNVIYNAGIAIMAQSNARPQAVLQLLQ